MLDTARLLFPTRFPPIRRGPLDTLQVNLGYRCNQSCNHCHVNGGPTRREQMAEETVAELLALLAERPFKTLDLTGGAPELHPRFRAIVEHARGLGIGVIDRCNLTILEAPGQEGLAEFLADQGVRIAASLPCYLEENVDRQRGAGVFAASIRALRRLNGLGYGGGGVLGLDLVFNPGGASLPPAQCGLEADYRRELGGRYGIRFDRLLTLSNMPIQRFGSTLLSRGEFDAYLQLLRDAHRSENLEGVMCRSLVSVDWRGFLYDCDFNQILDLPLEMEDRPRPRLRDLLGRNPEGASIRVGEHCYGCTAGQGSSCGGALGQ